MGVLADLRKYFFVLKELFVLKIFQTTKMKQAYEINGHINNCKLNSCKIILKFGIKYFLESTLRSEIIENQ